MKKIKRYHVYDAQKIIKKLMSLKTDLTPDEREELYRNREIVNNWEEQREEKHSDHTESEKLNG